MILLAASRMARNVEPKKEQPLTGGRSAAVLAFAFMVTPFLLASRATRRGIG